MNKWETSEYRSLLQLLVGDWHGDNPEDKISEIKEAKAIRTNELCDILDYNKELVVLEIGSGMGFGSKQIAKRVRHLSCCDISDSFLKFAKQECSEIENISFHKLNEIPSLPFSESYFDAIFSEAVFIHLNLFDIFWYFSEFKKIVKPGGQVWFNICDATDMDIEKFTKTAEIYRENKSSLPHLLCWNAPEGVTKVASHFGFALELVMEESPSIGLKFLNTNPS